MPKPKVVKGAVPKSVIDQLTSTLNKARKDRWAFQGDIWDLEKALKLMKEGKVRQAANLLEDLDTDCRERLSDRVWTWVMDYLHPDE